MPRLKQQKQEGAPGPWNRLSASSLSDYIVAHQEEFYRLAYSYVKNRDAALDVVQESIVKALAKSGYIAGRVSQSLVLPHPAQRV